MKNPYINKEIEKLVLQASHEHGIFVIKIAIVEDHIHMDVVIPFDISVSKAEMLIKGRSAYLIFRRFPNFRKRYPKGHFWSPGKFSRSMSGVTAETVRHYIENQQLDKLQETIIKTEEEVRQLSLIGFL